MVQKGLRVDEALAARPPVDKLYHISICFCLGEDDAERGPRARKSTTLVGQVSDFGGSWPQGGHARDKKMDIGLWKMDNGQ